MYLWVHVLELIQYPFGVFRYNVTLFFDRATTNVSPEVPILPEVSCT